MKSGINHFKYVDVAELLSGVSNDGKNSPKSKGTVDGNQNRKLRVIAERKDTLDPTPSGQKFRMVAAEKRFICFICKRRVENGLSKIGKIYSNEERLTCSISEYEFSSQSNLAAHMKVHTGETVFQCSRCKHQFLIKSDLAFHMQIHFTETLLCCSICNSKFSTKAGLSAHIRSHARKAHHLPV